jgi:hypothetical protein
MKDNREVILKKLRDDENYYGPYGKTFLSNSDIRSLLMNPKGFKRPSKPSLAMLEGNYLHTLILEPEKKDNFIISDSSSRVTKKYKADLAETDKDIILLNKEATHIEWLANEIRANVFLNEIIYDKTNKYEEPGLGEIGGLMWKGKADIVTRDLVVDIKTTATLDDFKYKARRYNYDSQAWIYQQLFGYPVVFIAIEKSSGRLGMFDCSEDFLSRGQDKVSQAIEVYNTFFGESPTEDINQYFINETL